MSKHCGVLLLLVASFQISLGGLLPNGNFEHPPNPSQMSGTKVSGKDSVPSWETSGIVEYIKSGDKQGDMLLIVPEGQYAIRLGDGASIKQKVRLAKGNFYALTFSFARTCAQEEELRVSVSPASVSPAATKGDSGVLPLQTVYSPTGFDSYSWGFQAHQDEVEITLENPSRKDEDPSCGPLVDTVAINLLRRPHPTGGNLVRNGNFEEGPYVFHKSTWGVLIPSNIEDSHCPLPYWIIESPKAVKYIDAPHFSVPVGKKAVELVAGKESTAAQVIRTVPGQSYVLTAAIGDAGNLCEGPMVVEIFADKHSVKVPYTSKGTGGFVRARLSFVADKTRTRIRFTSNVYSMNVEGSLCGPVIDDVKVLGDRRHPRRLL